MVRGRGKHGLNCRKTTRKSYDLRRKTCFAPPPGSIKSVFIFMHIVGALVRYVSENSIRRKYLLFLQLSMESYQSKPVPYQLDLLPFLDAANDTFRCDGRAAAVTSHLRICAICDQAPYGHAEVSSPVSLRPGRPQEAGSLPAGARWRAGSGGFCEPCPRSWSGGRPASRPQRRQTCCSVVRRQAAGYCAVRRVSDCWCGSSVVVQGSVPTGRRWDR